MTTQLIPQKNLRKPAIITGLSLLVMAVTSGFSYGYVQQTLIQTEQPLMTIVHLRNSIIIYDMGLVCWLVTLIADVLVSFTLYQFLKLLHHKGAIMVALSRLIYAFFLAVALSHLFNVHHLLVSYKSMSELTIDSISAQVMTHILAFESTFSFGLILFGIHLCLAGFVTFKSHTIPRILSVLLIFAGMSYILVHSLYQFTPNLHALATIFETILILPMTVGELGFGIWLLFKGGKSPL